MYRYKPWYPGASKNLWWPDPEAPYYRMLTRLQLHPLLWQQVSVSVSALLCPAGHLPPLSPFCCALHPTLHATTQAHEYIGNELDFAPFLAVHWRRGDFSHTY